MMLPCVLVPSEGKQLGLERQMKRGTVAHSFVSRGERLFSEFELYIQSLVRSLEVANTVAR